MFPLTRRRSAHEHSRYQRTPDCVLSENNSLHAPAPSAVRSTLRRRRRRRRRRSSPSSRVRRERSTPGPPAQCDRGRVPRLPRRVSGPRTVLPCAHRDRLLLLHNYRAQYYRGSRVPSTQSSSPLAHTQYYYVRCTRSGSRLHRRGSSTKYSQCSNWKNNNWGEGALGYNRECTCSHRPLHRPITMKNEKLTTQ